MVEEVESSYRRRWRRVGPCLVPGELRRGDETRGRTVKALCVCLFHRWLIFCMLGESLPPRNVFSSQKKSAQNMSILSKLNHNKYLTNIF